MFPAWGRFPSLIHWPMVSQARLRGLSWRLIQNRAEQTFSSRSRANDSRLATVYPLTGYVLKRPPQPYESASTDLRLMRIWSSTLGAREVGCRSLLDARVAMLKLLEIVDRRIDFGLNSNGRRRIKRFHRARESPFATPCPAHGFSRPDGPLHRRLPATNAEADTASRCS